MTQDCFRSDNPFPTMVAGRELAEQVFSRAAGAPLIAGNSITLLLDAKENYPAWLSRLAAAQSTIHLEMYIFCEDETGLRFGETLIKKARQGVRVRLLYDWMGCLFTTSERFWKRLRNAGVELRCFNPPGWGNPLGWLSRDHRKVIVVDGNIAFVSGLCIGELWEGNPRRKIEPWRDTGIEIVGPAVSDIVYAFSEVWAASGPPLAPEEIVTRHGIANAGDAHVRVIATAPSTAGIFRLDNLVAALAKKSLWLSDAYFVGVSSYVQALRSAAMDGVDVRLLVPGATDIPFLSVVSRSGYQTLLEAGVRVFEWNGPMMHAKTAVADGTWARVGSTNLNIASWMGNYELDVAVEDETFAHSMEAMFLRDLENSTEIVMSRKGVALAGRKPRRSFSLPRGRSGRIGRSGAGTLRAGHTVGAALTEHRLLGHAEAKITGTAGLLFLFVAVLAIFFPWGLIVPISILSGWLAISLLVRTYKLYQRTNGSNHRPKINGKDSGKRR